jgi:hypothetical protein
LPPSHLYVNRHADRPRNQGFLHQGPPHPAHCTWTGIRIGSKPLSPGNGTNISAIELATISRIASSATKAFGFQLSRTPGAALALCLLIGKLLRMKKDRTHANAAPTGLCLAGRAARTACVPDGGSCFLRICRPESRNFSCACPLLCHHTDWIRGSHQKSRAGVADSDLSGSCLSCARE